MRDPYQVLGVSSTATNDEIKRAYRNLARKYHPDNYRDNPLADVAQERMKAINEAYEAIQAVRIPQGFFSKDHGDDSSYSIYSQSGFSDFSDNPSFQRIRSAIIQKKLKLAEDLLSHEKNQNAEWFYLKGLISFRSGWMDEALFNYRRAVQMDPDNQEYQNALKNLTENKKAYRPSNYRATATVRHSDDTDEKSIANWCNSASAVTCDLCNNVTGFIWEMCCTAKNRPTWWNE